MVFISYTNQFRFPADLRRSPCPAGMDWAGSRVSQRLFDLLDALIAELPVDTNRIYVTGLSLGRLWKLGTPAAAPFVFRRLRADRGMGDAIAGDASRIYPSGTFTRRRTAPSR